MLTVLALVCVLSAAPDVAGTRADCCALRLELARALGGVQLDLNAGPVRLDRNALTFMEIRGYRVPRPAHPGGDTDSDALYHSPDGVAVACALHPESTDACSELVGEAAERARAASKALPPPAPGPAEGTSHTLIIDIATAQPGRFARPFQARVITAAEGRMSGLAPSPSAPPAQAAGRLRIGVPLGAPFRPSEFHAIAVGPVGGIGVFVWPDAEIEASLTDDRGQRWTVATARVSEDRTAPAVSLWELLTPAAVQRTESASPSPSPEQTRPLTPPR